MIAWAGYEKYVSEGETDWPTFFRKTIGLLLLWNAIEKEIGRRKRQGIYIGFNQNIIAYTLSLFSHQTKQKIDLFLSKTIFRQKRIFYQNISNRHVTTGG